MKNKIQTGLKCVFLKMLELLFNVIFAALALIQQNAMRLVFLRDDL